MENIITVLVVDDEVGIRQLFSEILTDEGYYVITADSAEAATSILKTSTPDVILLDIWLPDVDGITLLKSWTSNGPVPYPVIMVSGHGSIDMAVEATKIGAFSFLEKPVSMHDLVETVQNAVRFSSRQKALAKNYQQSSKVSQEQMETVLPASEATFSKNSIDFSLPFKEARELFEKAYFSYLLNKYEGSISKVAQHAKVERTNLYRKIDSLGIQRKEKKNSEKNNF